MKVTLADARAAGYCSAGLRKFAERHRLDWPRFLREGIPEEILAATGDAMALRAIEHARERHGRR